ncbi:MAG: hypothetical protein P8189_05505 [Anaerolineae bacterium]|jgi:hypothetical protein
MGVGRGVLVAAGFVVGPGIDVAGSGVRLSVVVAVGVAVGVGVSVGGWLGTGVGVRLGGLVGVHVKVGVEAGVALDRGDDVTEGVAIPGMEV